MRITSIPQVLAISAHGIFKLQDTESVLGNRSDNVNSIAGYAWLLEEDRNAKRAGGYARSYLGAETVRILEDFDRAEIWEMTGENLEEKYMGSIPAELADGKTSDTMRIAEYPVRKKQKLATSDAKKIRNVFLDDSKLERGSESSYMNPTWAFVFYKGKSQTVLVNDLGRVVPFLNGQERAGVF